MTLKNTSKTYYIYRCKMDRTTIHSLLIALLVIALPGCWHSEPDTTIVESNNITDIYQHLTPDEYNKDTLVIFDICNTIATKPTDLNSDQWVDASIKRKMQEGLSSRDALDAVLPIYHQVQVRTWLIPVEQETVSVVKDLQEKGLTVIALTARGVYLAYRTFEQLEQLGIYFSKSCPQKIAAPYGAPQPALYLEGIIFCGGMNKGDVLLHWLNQMDYTPQKIIFVDDKLKNINSVEQAMRTTTSPFIGIRYGHLDERVKNIDLTQTDKEYEQFLEMNPDSKPVTYTPTSATT